MKKKEDVLELFRKKYDHLKTIFPSVGEFKEAALYQTPDEGWQLSIDSFAAITLRPNDDEAHETHGRICERWYKEGGAFDEHRNPGWLGYPISDENVYEGDGDSNDRISHFEHGDIIWTEKKEMTRVVKNDTAASTMEKSPELVALLKEFDKEKESLDKVRQDLDQICVNQGSKKVFDSVMSKIARQRRAFDSKTFFMVTFGMLKAGKSTLVNTFVGREVSPIGRAKETTLRSSIILAADAEHKEGIYVYSPKQEAAGEDPSEIDKWQEDNLTRLMDYLGGMINRDELNNSLAEELLPLTGEELDNLLTREVDPRFTKMLPPVIRVDISKLDGAIGTANLLTGGVAIIDTPGLDGVKSNMHKDPFLRNIKSCGDYYLLVQSSMSAMNSDCRKQLDDIFKYTSHAHLLVVYNEIAASFWLKPELEKKKLLSDAENAAMELVEKLWQPMKGHVPDCISINAGESADAMFGPDGDMQVNKDEMLKESRILELRSRILRTLCNDRRAIKERNARDRMKQVLQEAINECKKQCQKIREEESATENAEKKKWEEYETKSGELCNAFNDKDGAGSRIAERYGDALKVSLEGKEIGLYKPWKSKRPKSNGDLSESKREIPDEKVAEELKKLPDQFRKMFIQYIEENFDKGELRRSNTPWKDIEMDTSAEWTALKEYWDGLREFLGGNCPSDDFPNCLLKGYDPNELVKFTFDTEFNPPPPKVENPIWRFLSNTKYECNCYVAWQDLYDDLRKLYYGEPGQEAEAIKQAQKVFSGAMKEKGRGITLKMQSSVSSEIRRMKQDSEGRREAVKNELRLFDEAQACMERMQAKLNVI